MRLLFLVMILSLLGPLSARAQSDLSSEGLEEYIITVPLPLGAESVGWSASVQAATLIMWCCYSSAASASE